jgi:branched-chain amino acid transport system ATP-binding protein
MPLLEIDRIDAHYGQVQVLKQVSLSVREKEVVSLLGSNGAGKTTTVNCISGILPVSRGTIRFAGEDITHLSAHQRVGLGLIQIPEGRKIFPSLTVEENLILGSFLKNPKSHRKESLKTVMNMFPILAERSKQLAGTLSGGEQQMLAIGRALMSLPRLLMLDEPSLGLAPLVVESIFGTIRQINREGVPILLVEQNVPQSLAISEHAFVLEEGSIALSGEGPVLLTNSYIKKLYLGLGEEET